MGRRGIKATIATALFATVALASTSGIGSADTSDLVAVENPAPAASESPSSELRILSYNVEGLPWPVARGRAEAADSIASSLHALRERGRQPQVIALQEAFTASAKRIGRDAGYPYAAFGPSTNLSGAAPVSAEDRDFVANARFWHGETLGKHVDSGLAIFSDYPILWVKRVAFPAYACAGWDCMANKGALAVAVRMPGSDEPVIVVDTHLNARLAGTPAARSSYAFRRQIDTLSAFVGHVAQFGTRVVMAGDFNISHDPARDAYFKQHMIVGDGLTIAAVEHKCGHACHRIGTVERTIAGKSMVAFKTGDTATLEPMGTATSFGRTADGRELSDHIGLTMRFRLGA